MALGARDHGRVGEPKRKVSVATDELADSSEVFIRRLEHKRTLLEVREEGVEDFESESLFDQVGDLREDAGGHQVRAMVGEQRLLDRFVVGPVPVRR